MEIIKQLSPEKTQQIIKHIQYNLRPLATAEQAKCARGRMNLWLQAEPIYSSGKYKAAYTDNRLWQFCQRIFPSADLAQIYFAEDGRGIDWHRDAAYAAASAMILNLGATTLESQPVPGNIIRLDLKGGEIIRFNSKHLHRSIPIDDARIGIGLWQAKIPLANPANWQ